jgi:CRISPR-associated exonuclease Cas4
MNLAEDWDEKDIVAISAIEHYLYCPRQCALIHIDGVYIENFLTLSGSYEHERVHKESELNDEDVSKRTGMDVYSDELGIVGKADLVEFLKTGGIFPVEFKHGKKSYRLAAESQLCAVALCLEEMTGETITEGAIYFKSMKRRKTVLFDEELRELTRRSIIQIREMFRNQKTPAGFESPFCEKCSLKEACAPLLKCPEYTENELFRTEE